MSVLTYIKNNKEYKFVFSGTPILRDLLEKTGCAVFAPCGGRGTCGKCAVKLEGQVSEPNRAEIKAGVRLACQAVLLGDARAELLWEDESDSLIEIETADISVDIPPRWKYGAAVDIGTTTVVLKLFSNNGKCIGTASAINPQRSVSADVIGRIDGAIRGKADLLYEQIHGCISELLLNACKQARIKQSDAEKFIVTGNTAMLYLYTKRSPEFIARAPFKSETLFGECFGENIYLPRCMNAFVGADITCAVLASGMCNSESAALLCDIGTNGEIALWKEGKLYITSTAAGPAFEGAEISAGCGSIPGAIDRVWIENGRMCAHTIDNQPALGICGSGLIDAIAVFLELGLIDETGSMEEDEIFITANGGTVSVTQSDIRAIQLAKSAIAAGLETVLSRSNTQISEISALYIAGGFGNNLSLESAARIGLIPGELISRSSAIGNAALSGAIQILFHEEQKEKSKQIAENSQHIDLGGSSDFYDAFIARMYFPE